MSANPILVKLAQLASTNWQTLLASVNPDGMEKLVISTSMNAPLIQILVITKEHARMKLETLAAIAVEVFREKHVVR